MDVLKRNAGCHGKESFAQLPGGHLKAEHHDLLADGSGIFRGIESPCGLADARSCGQDDKVSLLEASQYPVYVSEAGRYASFFSAVLLYLLQLLDVLKEHIVDVNVVVALRLMRYLENALLGVVKYILRRKFR